MKKLITKKIGIALLFFLMGQLIMAQTFEWARGFGNASSGVSIKSVYVDDDGFVYTVGSFQGTIDFDPDTAAVAVQNATSNGGDDIFIVKQNPTGGLFWVRTVGGLQNDEATSITSDGIGGILVTGNFRSAVNFKLSVGDPTNNLVSAGSSDVFILSADKWGNALWTKRFGGVGIDGGTAIHAIDAAGLYYITGVFQNTISFGFLPPMNAIGVSDIFVCSFDNSGNFSWANKIGVSGGGNSTALANSMYMDLYVTGGFNGIANFGGPSLTSSGASDIFIYKLDAISGNFIQAHQMGGPGDDSGSSIAIGNNGDIYTTGTFTETANFDPYGSYNFTAINTAIPDAFISKLSPFGNFIWAKQMGSGGFDGGMSIALDANENVYTTGAFEGTVDFNPGAGTNNLTSSELWDAYISKLDQNGNYKWAKQIGGGAYEYPSCIKVDANNSIYTVGHYDYTVDFDLGAGIYNLTASGSMSDGFVLKMGQCMPNSSIDTHSACDTYTWIDGNTYTSSNWWATHTLTNVAGCDSVVTLNLTIGNNTGVDLQTACGTYTWINGTTYTTSSTSATHTLTNAAGCDSVVTLDLTINTPTTSTDIQSACGTYTWIDGNTYTSSNNTAKDTLTNAAGCDSVVTLDLTINTSTTSTDVQSACDTYTWIDGNTYTSNNNIATHTLANAAGCDSVVTLNLTINTSTTSTDVQVACDEYTWIDGNYYTSSNNTATHTLTNAAGCDSVVTLNLTINSTSSSSQTITACNSYTWINGTTYTSSSMASHTVTNAAGCDSTISLFLTINTVDVTVTDNSPMLTSNAPTLGHQYQWIDCNNSNLPISGETYQSFTATSNGDYAVIVTGASGTCTDTSACVNITGVGINENANNTISIYPNPTSGKFTITSTSEGDYSITNALGQTIQMVKLNASNNYTMNVENLTNGIYFIIGFNNNKMTKQKVVVTK